MSAAAVSRGAGAPVVLSGQTGTDARKPRPPTTHLRTGIEAAGALLVFDLPSPCLLDDPNDPIPHLYRNRRDPDHPMLCLYRPNTREWHAGCYVAGTIIPWTSEWLACYEIWLATGRWLGGGTTPREAFRV